MDYSVYEPSLHKDLVKFATSISNANHAEDLVHSAYLCLLERKHKKEIKNLKGYMRRVILHILFKETKRKRKERAIIEYLFYQGYPQSNVSVNLSEILRIIEYDIEKDEVEDLIWEYHLEGYKEKEIAYLLDILPKNVRVLKQRVRRNIQKSIKYS